MNYNSKMTSLQRFWSLLNPDRKDIRNIYIFAVFGGILSLGLPLGIQAIINFIQMGQVSTSWIVLVFLVVAAIVFSGIMNIAQMRITENLQQRIFVRSAFEFADRIPKIKMVELIKRYAPELTNRFFDTITIQKGLSKLLIDFTAATLQILFGLILLSFYHPFFIFFGIILVFLLLVIFRLTAEKGFKSSLRESNYKYKIAHWLEEMAYARFSFKMAGNPDYTLERTNNYLKEYIKSRNDHFRVLMQQYSILIVFKALIAMALLVIGGLLVLNQTMNIGQFIAAEIIILLVLNSVEKLILSLEIIYDVLTALEKIGQVTDLTLETYSGHSTPVTSSSAGFHLTFENVSFASELYKAPILKEFSFNVHPNEKIGIVADSSISYNVLFNLVGGIYELQHGTISFDKLPLGNLNIQNLRNKIGNMLMQDRLINGTLEENISLGRTYVTFEEIQDISEKLGLTAYIANFTEGYATIVNPEAHFIPADVVRKILLARALVGQPRLVMIESPAASLNPEQIETVINTLNAQPNCTMLIATQDRNILSMCDRIIEIKNGQLIA
jgi:ABC-type bacteriocin/lantibiotic exporter with double-glycine peptidase domain